MDRKSSDADWLILRNSAAFSTTRICETAEKPKKNGFFSCSAGDNATTAAAQSARPLVCHLHAWWYEVCVQAQAQR